jgi:hypothetical protein
MSVSKQRKKTQAQKEQLKSKLINHKNQQHQRIMENQQPTVRQFPSWNSNAQISMTGRELEAIAQFMDNAQAAVMAYQHIVNRGLLEGTIELKYEKLNDAQTGYEPMSTEESAPYRAEFEALVKQAKDIAQQAKAQILQEDLAKSQENLPRIDAIVDQTGQEVSKKIII